MSFRFPAPHTRSPAHCYRSRNFSCIGENIKMCIRDRSAAGLEEDIPALCAQLETVTKEQVAQAAQKLQLDTIYFLKGKEGQHE